MLGDLLEEWTGLALFGYLSFRMAMAVLTAFAAALLAGGPTIRWLRARKVHDNVETSGSEVIAAESRAEGKHETPTMGGSFLMVALLFSVLCWCDVTSLPVVLAVVLTAGFGAVGFVDDYRKLTIPKSGGLDRRAKMAGLTICTLGVLFAFVWYASLSGRDTLLTLYPPFFKQVTLPALSLGWAGAAAFVLFQWFVIVGTANAANITDGLDGLAAGVLLISGGALVVFCYVTGRADWTAYLNLPFIPEAGDMAVVGAAMMGACLGFLWFNAFPAKVFMGDSGSLPLGGLLAWMAVVAKQELVLPLIAFVLVLEAASSFLQTFWYRRSGGRRIFTCAPIHHGLKSFGGVFRRGEKWHEVTVVIRLWIVAAAAALSSLALLKVR